MRVIPGNAQHIGARREQQDDFGFSDLNDRGFVSHGGILAVIADGMGGLAMGRDASRVAKQTMLREYEAKLPEESVPAALSRALEAANAAVYELSRQAGQEGEVGTTLAAAVVKDQELHWISAGDSRIYLHREGRLYQLTTDHDYGRELDLRAQAGQVSWEEARANPQRPALTSYLGLARLPEVDYSRKPVPLQAGDHVLLCSDGLYGSLSEDEMAAVLEGDPQDAATWLVEGALAKGKSSQDNITVAILACEPEGVLRRLRGWSPRAVVRGWGANWRQLAGATLVGILCGVGGLWMAARQWPALLKPGKPMAVTREAAMSASGGPRQAVLPVAGSAGAPDGAKLPAPAGMAARKLTIPAASEAKAPTAAGAATASPAVPAPETAAVPKPRADAGIKAAPPGPETTAPPPAGTPPLVEAEKLAATPAPQSKGAEARPGKGAKPKRTSPGKKAGSGPRKKAE
jgi:protein phosphatase